MLAFQAGTDEALDDLVGQVRPELQRFLQHLTNDACLADDLCHAVLLRVVRSRLSYRPRATFRACLRVIAANVYRNHIRHLACCVRLTHGQFVMEPGGSRDDELLERDDRRRILLTVLSRMHESWRTALQMWRADCSYREISEHLGMKLSATKSLVRRAKVLLRNELPNEARDDFDREG